MGCSAVLGDDRNALFPRILSYLFKAACAGARAIGGSRRRYICWAASLLFAATAPTVASAQIVGPGLTLWPSSYVTTTSSEVISGLGSVKGDYQGTGSYTNFLSSDSSVKFAAGGTYHVTFKYKVLRAPDRGFHMQFWSNQGSVGTKEVDFGGAAGQSGTATLDATLGPYSDYAALWVITGTGAVSVDDVQITDAAGHIVASGTAEPYASAPGVLALKNVQSFLYMIGKNATSPGVGDALANRWWLPSVPASKRAPNGGAIGSTRSTAV
jgi:hypothetical protein